MTKNENLGLYDPAFEHDACGIGFVAHIKGIKAHQNVTDALTILENVLCCLYFINLALVLKQIPVIFLPSNKMYKYDLCVLRYFQIYPSKRYKYMVAVHP